MPNNQLAKVIFGILGFALYFGALPLDHWTWHGWLIATLSFYGGMFWEKAMPAALRARQS